MVIRRDGVTIPRIGVAIAFSIAVHLVLLWGWRYDVHFPSALTEPGRGPLVVQIVPRATPPRAPRRAPAPEIPRRQSIAKAPPPKPAPAAPAAPRMLTRKTPLPGAPAVPAPAPGAPAKTPARPAETDLAAFVEARRRARGESSPAAASAESTPPSTEDANARATRLAAANLGSDRKPTFGSDPRKGGGVFTIERMGYDTAEFVFFGWNKDIQRNTTQLVEVRKGANSDIRIAVVRRMIAIIRDQEPGDFVWESKRLGRNVLLSARQRDTAGLEEFLMREFFEESRSRP